jgi:hypothetical protein
MTQRASYQLNKWEYIVLAKPSLLTVAPWGSRVFLIISSGVIITRLHSASSNAWGSHLRKGQDQQIQHMQKKRKYLMMIIAKLWSHMRRSAVIWRWNLDSSSSTIAESLSSPLAKSMLPRWRIAATTLNIASCKRERERERERDYSLFYCINYVWNMQQTSV